MKMKIDELTHLNWKKIGGWATIVAVAMISYYTLNSYKTMLEIKQIKKEEEENN